MWLLFPDANTTSNVSSRDLKVLKALMEEGLIAKYIIVSRDKYPQLLDNIILILPYREFLEELWAGTIA